MLLPRPVVIATRGRPLALAQTYKVRAMCQAAFPDQAFEVRIIKTTGDKLQTASMAQPSPSLPKGLFTKELEVALLAGEADFAVHSLKDLPTELPDGLILGAVPQRADVRDVLVFRPGPGTPEARGFAPHSRLADLPAEAVVATSSTRRREQVRAALPKAQTPEIRGNVGTRLEKLLRQPELHATILAAAGLGRLGFGFAENGTLLTPETVTLSAPVLATPLPLNEMLPCVGQGAIGIEIRANDCAIHELCERLDVAASRLAVTAERAFLQGMGGGCQSPVAAFAEIRGEDQQLVLTVASFVTSRPLRLTLHGAPEKAADLGREAARQMLGLQEAARGAGASNS